MHQTTKHLGFIGLGAMGSRMARRLLGAGYPMTVYNRTRAKAEALGAHGATVANSAREVASVSDYVFTSLTDDRAVEDAFFHPDGILAGARADAVCIDLSTIAPATARRVAEAARARRVAALDAPVSGSTTQAEEGKLVIFVGGDEATFRDCRAVLDVLGTSTHLGTNGMGATMKLVANTLLGAGMQALAEAIVLGEKGGLDRDRLLDVLGATPVVAPAHKGKLENVRRGVYPVAFALSLMYKDFGLILREAVELSVPMPVTAAAQQLCAAAQADGRREDYSAIVSVMEQLAAISVRGCPGSPSRLPSPTVRGSG
jgi:3-hydroxyisobutyrate dehydrogenase